jgi:colicin import membrane protein
MGRPGITYEMVEAAADALNAERPGSATLTTVRARLGTGSPNTVHKHLKAYDANRPKAVAVAVVIPPEINKAMSAWVTQAATMARAEAEETIVHAQAAADELARVGEELEAERDLLNIQIAAVTTARDQAEAFANERAAEIERLLHEVERERTLAGAAQVDAAQAKLKAEAQTDQLAEMRGTIADLTSALTSERSARTVAEREAAVLTSQLAGATKLAEDAGARATSLQQHLDAATARAEAVRGEHEVRIAAEQQRADKVRAEYEARLAAERSTLDAAAAESKAMAIENAALRARMEGEAAKIADLTAKLSAATATKA